MLVVTGALLLSVGAGIAQQDVVKQTQADMKGNGKALGGVLTPMVKGDKPYDQAAVNEALKVLDDTAKKLRPCSRKAPRV
jgi:cytochrome c556